ncbi:glycosyltransferase family 2 protein [Opitutales bacterium]|nr:glycosyltransferase family 2 protein [Opitutales bacterium]
MEIKTKQYNFSIIVPCFNESLAVSKTAKEIFSTLTTWQENENVQLGFELIFVNDGSTDDTSVKLSLLGQDFKNLKIIDSKANCGYGASLKKGILVAKYDSIVITDADGTYPNERIPELIKGLEKNDMVIGARIGKNVQIPTLRRPVKWLLLQYARWMSKADIKDLNSGLRSMKKDKVFKFWNMLPNAFSFTSTITLSMHIEGLNVSYLPIDYHARIGNSSIKPIQDTVRFFSLVLRTVMYFKPLQVFGTMGLVMLAVAICVGITGKVMIGEVPDVITVSLFSTGSVFIGLGLLGDLINARKPNTLS